MKDMFFFSSRRRHTRWPRDWSSDVCSSDLGWVHWAIIVSLKLTTLSCSGTSTPSCRAARRAPTPRVSATAKIAVGRSEERRVGKEGGARGARTRGRKEEEEEEDRKATNDG